MKAGGRSFYIPLCRRLGPERGGGAEGCGVGAPPGAEGTATKDAPRWGQRPRSPTSGAAAAPRGSPPAALRTQASRLSPGWGAGAAGGALLDSRTPGRDPGASRRRCRPSGARGPHRPQKLRVLPRMPRADDRALRVGGSAGRPLPPRPFQRQAPGGFGAPSLLPPFSPFNPLLSPPKGHT